MTIPHPFLVIPTTNQNERAIQTFHDLDNSRLLLSTDSGDKGWPIQEVTLYKNWFLRDAGRVNQNDDSKLWGNYVYWKQVDAPPGQVSFIWSKYKSEKEKNSEPFQKWFEQGNHYWHGILQGVNFFPDKDFPLSTNGPDGGIVVAARLYDRIVYIPPVSEGSLFEHRLYLSPSKFKIVQHQVPVPTAVSWDYHDSRGSFPECLHKKLVFPGMQSAFASFTTGGGEVSAFGSSPTQIFPETNFDEWAVYCLSDQQEQTNTGWLRHQIWVYPPDQPETIVQ